MSGSGSSASEGRPLDALLADYAAGTLSEPLAVLVSAHLQMKLQNRSYVASLEAAGGVLIDAIEPAPLTDRDRRLAAIYSAGEAEKPLPPRPAAPAGPRTDVLLPPVLAAYVGHAFDDCRWRMLLPGLRQCVLAREAAREVSFLRCRPGKRLPAHTHDGLEAALVLAGGYSDALGHYRAGDMAVADDTIEHRPIVDRDGECLIFLVLEGSVRLTGPFGRLLQRVMG